MGDEFVEDQKDAGEIRLSTGYHFALREGY